MKQVLNNLERLRKERLILYGLSLLLCSLMLTASYFFIKSIWLQTLLVFDCILIILIVIIFIEVNVGYKYEELYHQKFLPLLFKSIDQSYVYNKNPQYCGFNLKDMKLFDFDCNIIVNNVLRYENVDKHYDLYDIKVFATINLLGIKNQFKGYLLIFPNSCDSLNNVLLLYKKPPHLGLFKVGKEIGVSKYKLYQRDQNNGIDISYIINVLKKQLVVNNTFQVILNNQIMVLKYYKKSYYQKPFFRKVNEHFLQYKLKEFTLINSYVQDFIKCFEKNK